MTKIQFMNELYRWIRTMPDEDRSEVMSDYEEHFMIGKQQGRSEDEIAMSLGDPQKIAKELMNNYPQENFIDENKSKNKYTGYQGHNNGYATFENNRNDNRFNRAIVAILLIFANITFVLGPYIGIVGAVVGFWIAAIGMILAGVIGIIGILFKAVIPAIPFIHIPVSLTIGFFVSIASISLGVLLVYLLYHVTKLILKYTAKYIEFNKDIVNGNR